MRLKGLVRMRTGGAGLCGFGGGVFAVAGHEDDAQRRILLLQQRSELLPGHPGHDQVADEKIDFFGALGGELEGFLAVAGFDDGVAGGFEKFASEFADVGFVFGEQNGFGATWGFGISGDFTGGIDAADRRAADKF